MEYDLYYNYTDTSSIIGAVMITVAIVMVITVLSALFMTVVLWKIYKKAGKPGWASLVPFYNQFVLAEITWGNGWYFLISFAVIIPYIGSFITIIFAILTYIKLAKAFGKSDGFAVGLIFLNPIFLAILAFGKSQYMGIPNNDFTKNDDFGTNNGNNNYYQNNNQENMAFTNTNINNTSNNFCSNCGNKLTDNLLFCPNCGVKLK